MKVAVYGNNLNQGYWLVRHMRKVGVDATLVMLPYHNAQEYHEWWSVHEADKNAIHMIEVTDLDLRSLAPLSANPKIRNVYDFVRGHNILFLSEDGPAFFSELNGIKKVFRSAGADLQLIPYWLRHNWSWSDWKDALRRVLPPKPCNFECALRKMRGIARNYRQYYMYQKRQRIGLAQCAAMIISNDQKPIIHDLGLDAIPSYCLPMPMDVDNLSEDASILMNELEKKYQDLDLLFFHPTRVLFSTSGPNIYGKGNDKLIDAYASYTKTSRKKTRLVMCEKGRPSDIGAIKRQIATLGIESLIEWVPEMPNKAIRAYYQLDRTVVCGSFDANLQRLSNIGREASFFGCPIVTAFGEVYRQGYDEKEPPHIFHAVTTNEITTAMKEIEGMTPERRRLIQKQGRAWFHRNLTFETIGPRYLEIFEKALRS